MTKSYLDQADAALHLRIESKGFCVRYAILTHSARYAEFVLNHLASPRRIASHDQFSLHLGDFTGSKVAVAVTGVGSLATTLVVHELCAFQVERFCKFGSMGALQTDIAPGELVIPVGAVRQDGTSDRYVKESYPAVPSFDMVRCLMKSVLLSGKSVRTGIILTKNSYYSTLEPDDYLYWRSRDVLGIELECSSFFVLASLKRKSAGALLVVNRDIETILKQKSGKKVEWADCVDQDLDDAALIALKALVCEPSK